MVIREFFIARQSVVETYFFPSETNEDQVVNWLRTCKKTLDIAVFTITNDKFCAAIEEVWNAGCEVRIVTDDNCAKEKGSDIYKLASYVNKN